MSKDILKVIHETNRRNHSRSSAGPRSAAGYSPLLPELESRLVARLRARIDDAVERVASQLGSQQPTPRDLAETQEIHFDEQGSPVVLSRQLESVRSTLEHSLSEAVERLTQEFSRRSNDGSPAIEARFQEQLMARIDQLEEHLGTPLVIDQENDPARSATAIAGQVAKSVTAVVADLVTGPLEQLHSHLDERLAKVLSEEHLQAFLSSQSPPSAQPSGQPGTADPSLTSLDPDGAERLIGALGKVLEMDESQQRSELIGKELKRDFSHLVLTLNSHLEESRDRNRELLGKLEEVCEDLTLGRPEAVPAQPEPLLLQLKKDFSQLVVTLNQHLEASGASEKSSHSSEILSRLDRIEGQLQGQGTVAADNSAADNSAADNSAAADNAAGKTEIAALRELIERQGRDNSADLIRQLRHDFGLLVKTLNQQLEKSPRS